MGIERIRCFPTGPLLIPAILIAGTTLGRVVSAATYHLNPAAATAASRPLLLSQEVLIICAWRVWLLPNETRITA